MPFCLSSLWGGGVIYTVVKNNEGYLHISFSNIHWQSFTMKIMELRVVVVVLLFHVTRTLSSAQLISTLSNIPNVLWSEGDTVRSHGFHSVIGRHGYFCQWCNIISEISQHPDFLNSQHTN